MVTLLAGGTGTPKLLEGATQVWDPDSVTVVANTGDDVEIGGHLVCPDLDTVLFHRAGVLDHETWWGIAGDTTETHDELQRIADVASVDTDPRYLPDEFQTSGRDIAKWRRFSGVAEFMEIGDRDRAVHITRTSLIDEGLTLTEVTTVLADAFGLTIDIVPMSDDPISTIVHTDEGPLHFQEFWVDRRAEPTVTDVEYRGSDEATTTPAVKRALSEPVVIGPSNPVTSIGPVVSLSGVEPALSKTPVVAVSPFVEDRVFSGPAPALLAGTGYPPSTRGVADALPFVDAFVLDEDDGTDLDRTVIRTDTRIDDATDAERVARACQHALEVAS